MRKHECETLIISGIDAELHEPIRKFADSALGHRIFDQIACQHWFEPKYLPEILVQVGISHELHNTRRGVLINHHSASNRKNYDEEMQNAVKAISKRFPSLKLEHYVLDAAGTLNRIF